MKNALYHDLHTEVVRHHLTNPGKAWIRDNRTGLIEMVDRKPIPKETKPRRYMQPEW
jgi:hypothetical protein